ncbi:hypothetical protein [Roseovarius sp. Pro17]|nr:hypothetical protein [Roseovarius sp. Pro17]
MADISDGKVEILSTGGLDKSELNEPLSALKYAGVTVHVIAPEGSKIHRL